MASEIVLGMCVVNTIRTGMSLWEVKQKDEMRVVSDRPPGR